MAGRPSSLIAGRAKQTNERKPTPLFLFPVRLDDDDEQQSSAQIEREKSGEQINEFIAQSWPKDPVCVSPDRRPAVATGDQGRRPFIVRCSALVAPNLRHTTFDRTRFSSASNCLADGETFDLAAFFFAVCFHFIRKSLERNDEWRLRSESTARASRALTSSIARTPSATARLAQLRGQASPINQRARRRRRSARLVRWNEF